MIDTDTDIDIDFADREAAIAAADCIPASMISRGEHVRHGSSVYFQDIPVDPIGRFASITHKEAAAFGYFKIDFLTNLTYEGIRDEDHLLALMEQEPAWELFNDRPIVEMLPHIGDHFGTVSRIAPKSIEDLAVVIALIRPGKRHLLGRSRAEIDREIWQPVADLHYFKKPHAIAYAVSIVVRLNLICEQTAAELDG